MNKEIKKLKLKILLAKFDCLEDQTYSITEIMLFKNNNKHKFNWVDRHNRPRFDLYCKYLENNMLDRLLTQVNCDYYYEGYFNNIEVEYEYIN